VPIRCTAILSGNEHVKLSSIMHISILETTLETRKPYVSLFLKAQRSESKALAPFPLVNQTDSDATLV
jgi:hypothetical protein